MQEIFTITSQIAVGVVIAVVAQWIRDLLQDRKLKKQPPVAPGGLSMRFRGSFWINAPSKDHNHHKKRLKPKRSRNKR